MQYSIKYHPNVIKTDLPRISNQNRTRIKKVIEQRLLEKPEVYGLPLRRTLKGYWKVRVGDYRVIFKVIEQTIRIYGIIHRREVYKQILKRI